MSCFGGCENSKKVCECSGTLYVVSKVLNVANGSFRTLPSCVARMSRQAVTQNLCHSGHQKNKLCHTNSLPKININNLPISDPPRKTKAYNTQTIFCLQVRNQLTLNKGLRSPTNHHATPQIISQPCLQDGAITRSRIDTRYSAPLAKPLAWSRFYFATHASTTHTRHDSNNKRHSGESSRDPDRGIFARAEGR